MIIEISKSENKAENRQTVYVQLSPENTDEEKILRKAHILHANNLLVWWGDTLELHEHDKYVGYSGLKMGFNMPYNPDCPAKTVVDVVPQRKD